MPFAHCIDCGSSALIDPSGRCPEGHAVGTNGSRVASAIGVAGTHPDEPKPWVGVVDLDPAIVDAAPPEPRVARPLSVAGNHLAAPAAALPASSDDLLRELHALGDLDGFGEVEVAAPAAPAPAAPAPAAPAPVASPTPLAAAAPTVPPVAPASPAPASAPSPLGSTVPSRPATPPSSPQDATDLGDLASLAAAIESLDDRSATPPATAATPPLAPPAPTSPAPAPDSLWAPAEPTPAPAPPPFAPPLRAVTTAPDAPAPGAVTTATPAPGALATATPFDGSFTARGDGVGRRTQRRLDEKATKKGLFRR